MNRTGRVAITCHGDTAILPNARVLRYGTRWRRAGFTSPTTLPAPALAVVLKRNAGNALAEP